MLSIWDVCVLIAEPPTNPCEPDPCQNNGVCVHEGPRYACICPQGYQGTHCEIGESPMSVMTNNSTSYWLDITCLVLA